MAVMNELTWLTWATLPILDWSLSKNRIWRRSRYGGYYMTAQAREWKTALGLKLRSVLNSQKAWEPILARGKGTKFWLDVMVHRPDMRGDPVNVLDICIDAVQDAIGVDDRVFAIWRLDWQLDRENPRVEVKVGV